MSRGSTTRRCGVAFEHSAEVLVEEYVELGREVRCGIVELDGGLVCLPLEEYAVDRDTKPIRGYADKLRRDDEVGDLALVAKDVEHAWIVDRDDPLTERVWAAARACHRALGCRDYSLFDFRVDADGEPWFLEAGLYCSFAEKSVISVMAKAAGVEPSRAVRERCAPGRQPPAAREELPMRPHRHRADRGAGRPTSTSRRAGRRPGRADPRPAGRARRRRLPRPGHRRRRVRRLPAPVRRARLHHRRDPGRGLPRPQPDHQRRSHARHRPAPSTSTPAIWARRRPTRRCERSPSRSRAARRSSPTSTPPTTPCPTRSGRGWRAARSPTS